MSKKETGDKEKNRNVGPVVALGLTATMQDINLDQYEHLETSV